MIFVQFDISDLIKLSQKLTSAAEKAMKEAGDFLAKQVRAHIVEEAHKKLHTRRQMFVEHLRTFQVDEDTWVVSLDAKYRWIDDGMEQHSMVDDLLKSKNAKRAKDGSKYAVIPFEHGPKGPTQMTPAQATLLNTIKAEMKNRKIPYAGIEKAADGKAKLGLLHSFDITSSPVKTADVPGQGKGPIGQVMQGPTGIPLLKGVRVYQKEVDDKKGGTKIKKAIMTFRVVSSKHKEQGRWEHPGLDPVNLMEDGQKWAMEQWENLIAPQIVAKFFMEIS